MKSDENLAEIDCLNVWNAETLSPITQYLMQFKAMLLKRWYSFKRDWRMWLIMILPALIIGLFLTVGF